MLDRLWRRYRFWLLTGLGYLFVIEWTGYALDCPFRWLTGWQCPGCGVTHLVLALVHGDLDGAWQANPAIILASPFLLLLWFQSERVDILNEPAWQRFLAWGACYLVPWIWYLAKSIVWKGCLIIWWISRQPFIILSEDC